MESNNITLRFLLQDSFNIIKENKFYLFKRYIYDSLIYGIFILGFTNIIIFKVLSGSSTESIFIYNVIIWSIFMMLNIFYLKLYILNQDKIDKYSFIHVFQYLSFNIISILIALSIFFIIVGCLVVFLCSFILDIVRINDYFDYIKIILTIPTIFILSNLAVYIYYIYVLSFTNYINLKTKTFKSINDIFRAMKKHKSLFVKLHFIHFIFISIIFIVLVLNINNEEISSYYELKSKAILYFTIFKILFVNTAVSFFNHIFIVITFKHLIKNEDIKLEAKINEIGV